MPRIFSVNAVGALLAGIVMFLIGFVFYGLLFGDVFMQARGFSVADFEGNSPAWMGAGFLIELVVAIGIGWVIRAKGVRGLVPCLMTGVVLAVLVALPMLAYDFVYGWRHDVAGLLVDWGHALVAFAVGGAILSYFD